MDFQFITTARMGSYELRDAQDVLLTQFSYPKWNSTTGTATYGEHTITVKTQNLLHSAYDILINEVDKGDITFYKAQEHVRIRLYNRAGQRRTYLLRNKSFWGFRFVVEDEQKTPLLEMSRTIRWSRLKIDYGVTFAKTFIPDTDLNLVVFLLACKQSASLFVTMTALNASVG